MGSNNAPQPEESPDEMLARVIAELETRWAELTHDYYFAEADKVKQELAMLEAHQALRKYVTSDLKHPIPAVRAAAREALRQSDDAIRGMVG